MSVKKLLLVLVAAMVLAGGCMTTTTVTSTDGKAFIATGHMFGTKMYNCDATDGNPECWPVEEDARE